MSVPKAVSALRSELGQASWFARRYASRARIAAQYRVIKAMDVPKLPRSPRGAGAVWGVTVVKNEEDIIEVTVRHLLAQGLDHIIVADNGSTDGTPAILAALAVQDERVTVAIDREPAHHQSEKMTYLAHLAWRRGAEWILPFDADELFFARGGLVADQLRASDAAIMHAHFHHMVTTEPTRAVDESTQFVLDATAAFPGKVAARSHPLLEIIPGNHSASRVGAQVQGLFIAHALYRHPDQVARKFRQGMKAVESGKVTMAGEHWARGSRLDDTAIMDVWDRISHGLPDERILFEANGPMVRVRPLSWRTWDPDDQIPRPAGELGGPKDGHGTR